MQVSEKKEAKISDATAGFENGRGYKPRNQGQALEATKGQERSFSLEPGEGIPPCQHLDLRPTFGLSTSRTKRE